MRPSTSPRGRFQFSVEKAYSERYGIPSSFAARTVRSTALTPA